MEWNIFDKWIDVRLYRQMKDLIYVTCSKEDKYELNRENKEYELFAEEIEQTMDEEYGLHYPGEVLERLGEHKEVTAKQMRALGLALAKTKNLQEDKMFIGKQRSAFLKKLEGLPGENDPFLLGIRYLMDEKTKRQSYEAFTQYPFGDIAELLFALSILPEDDGFWNKVKGKLNAKLGKEREISVYENTKAYVWLAQNFQFRVKGYRKKDMDAFKYLMRLPFENASGKGTVGRKLLENGYGREEISFLNCRMLLDVKLPGMIGLTSITAEKIAINACQCFLGAKKECSPQAYALCRSLCHAYKEFNIKVNGYLGIAGVLADTVVAKNVDSFLILFPYLGEKIPINNWSCFDLTDSRWDAVYASLSKSEYEACATSVLLTDDNAEKISAGLKRYQELTGEEYLQKFWKGAYSHMNNVFEHLADYGAVPVKQYLEQSLKEYGQDEAAAKEKWKYMAWYLQHYMEGISSYEAFTMLEFLIKEVGITKIDGLYSVPEILRSCFVYKGGGYYNRKMDIFRPFLEAEEHQKLFLWIEEYIFKNHPEDYGKFLVHALSNQENLIWFPKEEARAVFLGMCGKMENVKNFVYLRRLYLTEGEQEALQSREKFLEERRMQREHMEEIKELKREFTERIAESRLKEGQFQKIKQFWSRNFYHYDEVNKMVSSYIRALAKRGQIKLLVSKDLKELLDLLSSLYMCGAMDLETIKEMVEKVKMQEQTEEMEVAE